MDTTIIRADAQDIADINAAPSSVDAEQLTRQQKRLAEREQEKMRSKLNQPARIGHFVELAQAIGGIRTSLSETDISFMALVELLEEKGILTKEEVMQKEASVFGRLTNTPNSPAAAEAEEASKSLTETPSEGVQRLDEVPPVSEADESAPRRIVEG